MKICSICKQSLDESEFAKDKSLKCGLTAQCKKCRNEKKKEWAENNKDKVKAYTKKYRSENLEKIKEENKTRYKEYYNKNKDKLKAYQRDYKKSNKAKVNSWNSKRRAIKLLATPDWVLNNPDELKKIEEMYKKAEELTLTTGIKHHVDHIIPLQGNYVSGFHCLSNLQILTEEENTQKGNYHESDNNFK